MSQVSGHRKAAVTNASGTLAQTPLANALVYIRNKKLTGVLELRAPGGREAKIDLWRGMIAHITTTPAVARFGSVVYEMGLIDAATLDSSGVDSVKKQKPQADLLVESGKIDKKQRDEAQLEQIRRRVHHTFTYPADTRFEFTEATPAATEPRILVDPLAPVWRGLLDFPPKEDVLHVLQKVGHLPLRMVSESALERAGLVGEEKRICEAIALEPMTVAQLRSFAKVPPSRVDLLVYLLVIAKCASPEPLVASGTLPAADVAKDSDAAEPAKKRSFRLSGSMAATDGAATNVDDEVMAAPIGPIDLGTEGIKKRAASLAFESPYDALGLREGASVEAARAAYVRLAKLWHPDRLPLELEPVQAEVTRIYVHVRDSFRAITAAGQEAQAAT
jgi:hypothetical protein